MPQPYQLFFPLGLLYAIYGAAVWVMYWLAKLPYPAFAHAHLMISGFLFSFVSGFLMTAIPKFLGARQATGAEITVAALLNLSSLMAVGAHLPPIYHYVGSALLLLFLAYFCLARFVRRDFDPPPHFVFLALGLAGGALGSLVLIAVDRSLLSSRWLPAGRAVLYQGTMLFLVIGVGGRMLRNLLGWNYTSIISKKQWSSPLGAERLVIGVQATALVASFVVEALTSPRAGHVLRAAIISWIAVTEWRLYRRPRMRSKLAFWLWISIWSLVVGSWAYALIPGAGVHGLHIVFIGGLGLMALMIASRVTLAHGGHGVDQEKSLRALRYAGILILFAALTRAAAPLTPQIYTSHLAYAAITWIAGLLVWAAVFVPKIIFTKSGDGSHG